MDYQPTITVESKVLPGVRYTLHRTTAPRRARFQESVQEYRAQVREIQRQRKPLDEEYQKALDAALAVAKVEVDQLVAEGMTREDAEARVRVDIKLPDDKYTEWADSIEEQRRIEKSSRISGINSKGFWGKYSVPSAANRSMSYCRFMFIVTVKFRSVV